jgi:2-desacetyl-2-hydroxyethyl bacteriochlorophyllide A dehydrogenase
MAIAAIRAVVPAERELRIEAFDLPEPPGPSEVIVRMLRTIVSAGTELANYTALEPDVHRPGAWCAYPWVPGYGGIGEITASGRLTGAFAPGGRVYGIFRHASHEALEPGRALCVPVPASLDSTTAVFARMGNVAITAPQRAPASLGERVGVIGLGLVGNLAAQLYGLSGALVTGVDPVASRRAAALACGVANVAPEIEAIEGCSIVLDAVGSSQILERAVELVSVNGRVVSLGSPRAPHESNVTRLTKAVHARGVSLVGALEWNIPLLARQQARGGISTESNARLLLQLLATGKLHTAPLATHLIDPRALKAAYEGLLGDKDTYLGVVLDWEHLQPGR